MPRGNVLLSILPFAALLAMAVALLVDHRYHPAPSARHGANPTGAPPAAALPVPEPLRFAPIAPATAREMNLAVPFAIDRGPAARPFAPAGDAESRVRAVDCLAVAMLYEAGDDDRGQRAVAQVVLNRVRHPAYPSTVCAVTFQGSERVTGCQFTFTCDGALLRSRRLAALAVLDRARARALAMYDGAVDKEVGTATHYHTDWVHPVWSAEMDKIAQVDTHLFFRWHGPWGRLSALRQRYIGGEPIIPALATLSPAHMPLPAPVAVAGIASDAAVMPPPLAGSDVSSAAHERAGPRDLGDGVFQLAMTAGGNGAVQAMVALELCGTRRFCKVYGRTDGGSGGDGAVFVYVRDRSTGVERALWDCALFKRANSTQCLTPATRPWLRFDGGPPPDLAKPTS